MLVTFSFPPPTCMRGRDVRLPRRTRQCKLQRHLPRLQLHRAVRAGDDLPLPPSPSCRKLPPGRPDFSSLTIRKSSPSKNFLPSRCGYAPDSFYCVAKSFIAVVLMRQSSISKKIKYSPIADEYNILEVRAAYCCLKSSPPFQDPIFPPLSPTLPIPTPLYPSLPQSHCRTCWVRGRSPCASVPCAWARRRSLL
jgi:hypothetical protein